MGLPLVHFQKYWLLSVSKGSFYKLNKQSCSWLESNIFSLAWQDDKTVLRYFNGLRHNGNKLMQVQAFFADALPSFFAPGSPLISAYDGNLPFGSIYCRAIGTGVGVKSKYILHLLLFTNVDRHVFFLFEFSLLF